MKTLKVGLLLDSVHSDKYVEELALWAKDQPEIDLSHLIVRRRSAAAPDRRGAPAIFRIILALERLLLRWSGGPHKDHFAVRDLRGIVERVVDFSGDDVAKLRLLGLDLLVHCAATPPDGALLAASRLGVIAFLRGDDSVGQEGFAGFWECYYRWPQTRFVIRKLTDGARDTLAQGSLRTRFYYSLNQASVCKKSVSHLKNLLKKVAATRELPSAQEPRRAIMLGPIGAPGLMHCIIYGCKLLGRVFRKALGRLPMLNERFGVSVLRCRWYQPFLSRSRRTLSPRGRYWADPFLCTRGGRTFCFVEDLDMKTNRGHITALEVVGTRLVERGVALQEPFHLSFPFLFEYQGGLYMCPERSESREIAVYRCTEFPLKWRLEKTLMTGVSAADAMLFEKAGRWWMLVNIDESETGDHCSELYLFSAASPLSTAWAPHPQNPIVVDSLGGRNGGLIIEGERVFRLGQCQSFDRYGESLRVHEIKEISDTRYSEELVVELKPNLQWGISGTHHLSTDGNTTVIDYASRPLALRG